MNTIISSVISWADTFTGKMYVVIFILSALVAVIKILKYLVNRKSPTTSPALPSNTSASSSDAIPHIYNGVATQVVPSVTISSPDITKISDASLILTKSTGMLDKAFAAVMLVTVNENGVHMMHPISSIAGVVTLPDKTAPIPKKVDGIRVTSYAL